MENKRVDLSEHGSVAPKAALWVKRMDAHSAVLWGAPKVAVTVVQSAMQTADTKVS